MTDTMTEFVKQRADLIQSNPAPEQAPVPGVAQALMEQAEADAGRNPAEAEALRAAARAFLSVVR